MRSAEMLKKYKQYVENLKWHLRVNNPNGNERVNCEARIGCYEEIVKDLQTLVTPHLNKIKQP